MGTLALLGGTPVLDRPLPPYPAMGEAERRAVDEVMRSGVLSGFYGSPGEEFWGGPRVRAFEAAWSERFATPHAVSVNSATSGLLAALGALGLSPGDQVIVPPFTMSATATAPLFYGAIPVFADVEPETFCLDPDAVAAAITPRTRVILAVNLFGHPARLHDLRALAETKGLALVEDNAQGPLAEEHGRLAGTVGHIGVFSLNFHKHIHCGEGGMCVTADPDLALRMQLIRNHGENLAEHLGLSDLTNLVGGNYRLSELHAAVGLAQLADIDRHVQARQSLAEALSRGVAGLEGLTPPRVRPGCRHVYYEWVLRLDPDRLGVSRETFSAALAAEGFPHFTGYVQPLYLLPLFQRRIAFGRQGHPFNLAPGIRYPAGLCPICERLYQRELLLFEPCACAVGPAEQDLLVEALRKVHSGRGDLARWERSR